MPSVTSIIVTYHPEPDELAPLLGSLLQQTACVVLVDNTPGPHNPILASLCQKSSAPERCIVLRFGENLGIAKAINEGCDYAKTMSTDFVLLSDQDSLPDPDMVEKLVEAYHTCNEQYGKVAAVGPTYTDVHTKLTYPFQIQLPGNFFYSHAVATETHPYIEALSLITSGKLIPISVLQHIGPMREDFFIDHVDIEWSMRARHLGYRLIGSGPAKMHQRMGLGFVRVWYLGWRNESLYGSIRIYYRLRNFVALLKEPSISWRWKIRSSWYWLGFIYTHVIFSPHRYKSALYSAKGIFDGIRGHMGKCEKSENRH